MTGSVVGVEIRPDDIGESFPARGLRVSNVKDESGPKRDGSRYLVCPECGKTFYRPSVEWGYRINSMFYDRGKGLRKYASGKPRVRYLCSYGCMRKAQKIADAEWEKAQEEFRWAVCAYCGEEFPTRNKAKRTLYCCREHREKARYLRERAARPEPKTAGTLIATVLPMMNK